MSKKTERRVAIVTDSTCDLPGELVEQYKIQVVPQILIMGERTWQDGVDIDPPAFYELLRTSSDFPSSSQPSVVTFQEVFSRLSEEVDGIVAAVVSDELSGTLNSAQMAAANLPDVPIEVIDTRAVSMQLGFIVLAAARAAAAGASLQAVADTVRDMIGGVTIYFVVDTLEYLHRGGRIGAAARLFGTALSLKPVLTIDDGIVTPVTKVRTRRKARDKVLDLVQDALAGQKGAQMAVLHIAAPDEAGQFMEQLETRFRPAELICTECGPVVGTHAGPGTLGVAFYVES